MLAKFQKQLETLLIDKYMENINMNKIIEKTPEAPLSSIITEALLKLKKEQPKGEIDLTSIAKKLSSRKFEKK